MCVCVCVCVCVYLIIFPSIVFFPKIAYLEYHLVEFHHIVLSSNPYTSQITPSTYCY